MIPDAWKKIKQITFGSYFFLANNPLKILNFLSKPKHNRTRNDQDIRLKRLKSMENFYRNTLPSYSSKPIQEQKKTYAFLTERHLQAAWLEQRYFHFLKMEEGKEVKVLSPGIWNLHAGPDFLKAHLIIDGQEIKGDVEIHFNSTDWYHHHHHEDDKYNNVILHVVLWKPRANQTILTKNQKTVNEVFLEDALTVSYEKLVQLIDLDLYPHQNFAGSGKCAKQLFPLLSQEALIDFFRSAAAWRLIKKYEFLSGWVEDPSLFLAAGFAMALGYKNNTETFLYLFLWMYPLKHLGEEGLLAIAMGVTGFFRSVWQKKWEGSEYYRHLYSLYLMHSITRQFLGDFKLNLHQVRPLNYPLRRLVALVKLILDPNLSHYFDLLMDRWNQLWPTLARKKKWNLLKTDWLNLLPSYPDPYWNHHFAFEIESKQEVLPLIGGPLKQEVITNTLFPLLYQKIVKTGNADELKAFFSLYSGLSISTKSKLKYLKHRFFGNASKGNILAKADLEQGAYQLHKDFCLHYEASCEGCPFIGNFMAMQGLGAGPI